MSNFIDKFSTIQPNTGIQRVPEQKTVVPIVQQPVVQREELGTNILEKFLQNQGVALAATQVVTVDNSQAINTPHKNDLRTRFQNNDATLMGIIIRTLGAKDNTGNQLIREGDEKGTLVNAVSRFDEMKNLGINTFHVLPIHPPGKTNAMGTAGSVYAPQKFVEDNGDLAIDPEIVDENPPAEAREAIAKIYKEKQAKTLLKWIKMTKMSDLPNLNILWMNVINTEYQSCLIYRAVLHTIYSRQDLS